MTGWTTVVGPEPGGEDEEPVQRTMTCSSRSRLIGLVT